MKWSTDAAAQYRLRDALAAGKRVVRKIDGYWYAFGIAQYGIRCGSHDQAIRLALTPNY